MERRTRCPRRGGRRTTPPQPRDGPRSEECWRPSLGRNLIPKISGLVQDLAACLRFDNGERAHRGRLTAGRAPLEASIGAGQAAAATTKTCRTTPQGIQPGR